MSDWPNEHFYQQLLIMCTEFIISLLISTGETCVQFLNQAQCSVTKTSNYIVI